MIELKKLSKEERYDLVRGCSPFFIVYKSPQWQTKLVKKLKGEFGNRYENEIKVILTASSKCKRHNLTGIQISLTKESYKIAKDKTGLDISHHRMRKLLGFMDESGYLTLLVGYKHSDDDCMQSCIRFHPKLLDLLVKKHCDKWGLSRTEGIQFLEIVDTESSTKKSKKFHSLKKFKGSGALRDEVVGINKILGENIVTFNDQECVVIYKRRFEGDLENGGRLYTIGTFQTESSGLRHTIKINGEETTEVDLCHIHPAIHASKLGITLPDGFDPYDINYILNYKGDLKHLRSFVKVCTMCLFYAKHRGSALYEIRKKLRNDNELYGKVTEKDILEALEDHNFDLHEFFYNKEMWKFNQFIDSSIIIKVMKHFTDKGIPVLSYHDSIRCAKQHQEELITVMRQSWITVIGNDDNFKYKIND